MSSTIGTESRATLPAGDSLPPLYFQGALQPNTTSAAEQADSADASSSSSSSSSSPPASAAAAASFHSLPSELVQHCLASYADWGDLAKLSTVQSSWTDLVRDAADHGGHDAKWQLCEALLGGTNGLEANPALAVEYLVELAGVDVTEGDDEEEEAALAKVDNEQQEPFAPAMRKLATCHLTGTGVPKNTAVGIKWLDLAYTVATDVDAAHELALIHEYGEHGVEIDVVKAAIYFLKSAEGGHVEGMAEYALCCELGCGREQDDELAMEWYVKAAEAGHVNAKFSVGEAFEEARGVPQSDTEACLWYYKAAVEGDEDSKRALKRLRDIARIVLPGWEGVLDA